MSKIIDKIITSATPPNNTNVLWNDGKGLNIHKNGKWESTGSIPMMPIKYEELVNLRDNGKLVAGMQYRITDYVTTTTQENTKSAGNQFDVIVTADNENTLNEVARACLHEGDTYFSENGARLETWKIWYCLDNDIERFAWADTENGKGVIYRMVDEWNNDCPYDFKNIQYVENLSFECSQYGVSHTYTKNNNVINIDSIEYYGYTRTRQSQGPPPPPATIYITDEIPTINSIIYTIEDNIATPYSSATIDSVASESGEYYTFDAGVKEGTVSNNRICYNNVIREYYNDKQQRLNRIVFKGKATVFCCCNTFGEGCHDNTFKFGCAYNSFGIKCHNNSFSNNCNFNTFGKGCHSNNFEHSCSYNSLGHYCQNDIFENNCNYNNLDCSCNYIILRNFCINNTVTNSCYNVELSSGTAYKTVSKKSNNEVKVFNIADLADLLNS